MADKQSAANLSKLRTLIVEDNEHMRALLRTVLSAIGVHTMLECFDGEAGLKEVETFRPDFIITDLNMLPMDGLDFARAIRRKPSQYIAFLPIIMVTGHTEKRRIEAARDAGVTEILAKPMTTAGLLSRISEIILRPRPFVRCENYYGPCRRRRVDPEFTGPFRRDTDGVDVDAPRKAAG